MTVLTGVAPSSKCRVCAAFLAIYHAKVRAPSEAGNKRHATLGDVNAYNINMSFRGGEQYNVMKLRTEMWL